MKVKLCTCIMCGASFTIEWNNPNHARVKYCSPKCSADHSNIRHGGTSRATVEARRAGVAPLRVCIVCGQTFKDTRKVIAGRYSLVCSDICRTKRRQALRYKTNEKHIDSLHSTQRDKCALCDTPFTKDNPAQIDHNHTTGVVRGLLCKGCNIMLGWYEKRKYRLASYLGE